MSFPRSTRVGSDDRHQQRTLRGFLFRLDHCGRDSGNAMRYILRTIGIIMLGHATGLEGARLYLFGLGSIFLVYSIDDGWE